MESRIAIRVGGIRPFGLANEANIGERGGILKRVIACTETQTRVGVVCVGLRSSPRFALKLDDILWLPDVSRCVRLEAQLALGLAVLTGRAMRHYSATIRLLF